MTASKRGERRGPQSSGGRAALTDCSPASCRRCPCPAVAAEKTRCAAGAWWAAPQGPHPTLAAGCGLPGAAGAPPALAARCAAAAGASGPLAKPGASLAGSRARGCAARCVRVVLRCSAALTSDDGAPIRPKRRGAGGMGPPAHAATRVRPRGACKGPIAIALNSRHVPHHQGAVEAGVCLRATHPAGGCCRQCLLGWGPNPQRCLHGMQ